MSKVEPDGPSDDTLDEGCYYLSGLGLRESEIAQRFELTEEEVKVRCARFGARLKSGDLVETESDRQFWRDVMREAEGNIKLTFVTEKGFHHAWKSDLAKLDTGTLFGILESCKHFLGLDPSARFLEYSPPKNYDPLAMQRELRRAVTVVEALLEARWNSDKAGDRGGIT